MSIQEHLQSYCRSFTYQLIDRCLLLHDSAFSTACLMIVLQYSRVLLHSESFRCINFLFKAMALKGNLSLRLYRLCKNILLHQWFIFCIVRMFPSESYPTFWRCSGIAFASSFTSGMRYILFYISKVYKIFNKILYLF